MTSEPRTGSHANCFPSASCVCPSVRYVLAPTILAVSGFFTANFLVSGPIYLAKDQSSVGAHLTLLVLSYEFVYKEQCRNHRIRRAGALRGAVRLRDSLRGRRDAHVRALEIVRVVRHGAGVSKRGISPTVLVCASALRFCETDHGDNQLAWPARLAGLPIMSLWRLSSLALPRRKDREPSTEHPRLT